jgi:hypothetical protein
MSIVSLYASANDSNLGCPFSLRRERKPGNISYGCKSEISQQSPKPVLCPVEVQIVAETTFRTYAFHPWLRRVYFPRMEVEYKGTPLPAVYFPEPPVGKVVRVKPKVTTTGNGNAFAGKGKGRYRYFKDL